MCGIAGSFGLTGFKKLNSIFWQRHRGPDSTGIWLDDEKSILLEHVRLSIIDTSQAGLQPMVSHCGNVVMVYNGEIYNYLELRAEMEAAGETFKGNSDSEVFLAMFAREGAHCFTRLNGIFAAAFWERDVNTLTLVRDPFGVKPLYVAASDSGFAFASEMKVILRSGMVEARLNPNAVLAHLGYLWSPGRATVVQGVSKVLPGHVVRVREGKVISDRSYRDIVFKQQTFRPTDEQAALQVAAAVKLAVGRQMAADVPLGAFLSGGLDSSAVAAFAQQNLQQHGGGNAGRLQCFSIEVKEALSSNEGFASDLPFARRVATHLGVDLQVVQADKQMMDRLPEMVYMLDEPTADPAALNSLLISELARSQGIKVLLSGTGGDDIFTGYRRHYALMQERWWSGWPAPLRSGLSFIAKLAPQTHPLARRFSKAFRYANLNSDHRLVSYFLWLDPAQALDLLHEDFRAGLTTESLFDPMLQTLGGLTLGLAPLNRMLYLECKHFLADHNLNYTDKMGMSAGVEVRVPLLDMDLTDLAFSLPEDMKQRGSVGKWIFKKAMEPYLPHDVIYRSKTGFGVPLRSWLNTILKPLADDVFSDTSLSARGVFNPVTIQKLRRADQAGLIDASYTLFSIICLELWCRQYLDCAYQMDVNP